MKSTYPRTTSPSAVLLTVAFALCATSLFAQTKNEKSFEKAKQKVAKEHAKIGEWADDEGLHRYGYLEWSDVLEFDPDEDDARERLGYEETDAGWIRSRSIEVKKIDDEEKVTEDNRRALEREYEQRRIKVKDKALKEFGKVLKRALKDDEKDLAKQIAKIIRRYDPKNKEAIAALGLAVDKDGRPVEQLPDPEDVPDEPEQPAAAGDETPQVGRGANRHAQFDEKAADRHVKQLERWRKMSGLPLEHAASRHHCIVSTAMPPAHMQELTETAEQTRTRFYQRYQVPNDVECYSQRMTLIFLASKDEHQRWVDAVYAVDPANESLSESYVSFVRNRTGGGTFGKYFAAWNHSTGEQVERDWVIHYGMHLITSTFNAGLPTWMEEAVAYEQSIGLQATSWTSCINDETTGDRSKDWADPVNWRELIRGQVRLGEDTPFSSIVTYKPNDIDPKIAAKCWSFLTWLLDTKGDKVFTLLQHLRGDDKAQFRVFEGVFGKPLPELEEDWRNYVKDTY